MQRFHNQNGRQALLSLARSFPTLSNAPIESDTYKGEIDPEKLDAWGSGPEPSHGARVATQFVLSVFNNQGEWKSGRFELHDAMCTWDTAHRTAFLRWAGAPWWP